MLVYPAATFLYQTISYPRDSDNRIRIPAPVEFSRTPEPAPSVQLPKLSDASQEALPIPPPVQPSASQPHRRLGHRRNSSSGSSTLSTLDIINEPFGGNLRTPMSAIPEVLSQYTGSPLPRSIDGEHDMRPSTLPSRLFPSTTTLLVVTTYRPVHCRIEHPKRVEVPHPDIVSLFLLHLPDLQGFPFIHNDESHHARWYQRLWFYHHPVRRDLHIETTTSSSSRQNQRQSPSELNSAVSLALTADTLMTPPPSTLYRTLRQDGIEPSGSQRTSRAGSPSSDGRLAFLLVL